MSGRRRGMPRREAMLVLAVVILIVAGTWLYILQARPRGDANLAGLAVDALYSIDASARAETPEDAAEPLSLALADSTERVDAFLISTSADRMPLTAAHLEASLAMFTIANEVWIARDGGISQPVVADIAGAELVLARFPDVRRLTLTDEFGTLRIDNSDMRAVSELLLLAESELQQAESRPGLTSSP